ncbi:hypothetical protein MPTK1_8g12910 [Marchantia polymorpha subsp. ruderalis]|uniref:Uncharacterized protein n=1 Tax=Marchantia polymorpha TaxID=3197 RepID=A0A2R6WJR2_MARPO|nr:hypothetical protein MARPO_0083s0029 [Marchantia polymorpha]PTQ34063.1 hypothetical protein MARPO_0083s0031 [Marchantia polymorpha]BBN19704.1 hypothetical protein Mp_8g12900 [Marchantia polymorpha subsp. ruderalis]BBN19705.1 hypothetical protein Mp_8g12910 [Marchantia polymorpha subsp. ruderalis]|eukprot:PTQ34061.1 hypothetical protein MARPO_0083s0029 [Marchantia polymorpha]
MKAGAATITQWESVKPRIPCLINAHCNEDFMSYSLQHAQLSKSLYHCLRPLYTVKYSTLLLGEADDIRTALRLLMTAGVS